MYFSSSGLRLAVLNRASWISGSVGSVGMERLWGLSFVAALESVDDALEIVVDTRPESNSSG